MKTCHHLFNSCNLIMYAASSKAAVQSLPFRLAYDLSVREMTMIMVVKNILYFTWLSSVLVSVSTCYNAFQGLPPPTKYKTQYAYCHSSIIKYFYVLLVHHACYALQGRIKQLILEGCSIRRLSVSSPLWSPLSVT